MAAELLICVVNDPAKVEEILEAFIDIGVTGATIVDTYGMGHILTQDIPIFAGFRSLLRGASNFNKTIFSVVKDSEIREAAVAAIESICGSLDEPSTGIVFTIPVSFVKGLKPPLV